jgi:hypothetical protein
MMPVTVAFSPPNDQGYHPPPWKAARGGFGHDITAQLIIPAAAATTVTERLEMARVIAFLIRLWSDPSITMPAASNMDFSKIAEAADGEAYIVTLEGRPRFFCLEPVANKSEIPASLQWVVQNFESAWNLWRKSSEFRLAVYALDTGQFVDNTALTLISLWGALEAIFSPSTQELKFRVSSLIAAYLYSAGPERMKRQKEIASLYDARSAAAHGKPRHTGDELLATFELLRKALIKFIVDGFVPTKVQLEERLFGS